MCGLEVNFLVGVGANLREGRETGGKLMQLVRRKMLPMLRLALACNGVQNAGSPAE